MQSALHYLEIATQEQGYSITHNKTNAEERQHCE